MSHSSSNRQLLPFSLSWLDSLWKFSRPHTIIGTSLSVLALYAIALATTNSLPTVNNVLQLLGAWLACLGGNVYIVGLNQIEDVAIDKINKPHLPIAAGEFSLRVGKLIVAIAGVVSLLLAGWLGIWLWATVAVSLAIGTAYSLPPVRLKRFPLWAAFCIFTVRGVIVNLGLFLHFSQRFGSEATIPPSVWTLTAFILVFTVAIAIFKDVPDLQGDKQYQIVTLTILVGKPTVFNLSRGIITSCYLGTLLAGAIWLNRVTAILLAIAHLILLAVLWWRSRQVDLEDKSAIASFYQFIWKLFFCEYLLFPAACILGS